MRQPGRMLVPAGKGGRGLAGVRGPVRGEGDAGVATGAASAGVFPWTLRRAVLFGVPITVLCIALLTGLLGGIGAQRAEDRRASDEFESAARRRVFTLFDRFHTYMRCA